MAHRLVLDRTHRGSVLSIEGIRMRLIGLARIFDSLNWVISLTLLLDLDGDFGTGSARDAWVVINVDNGIPVGIGLAMPFRIHLVRKHFYAVR